MSFFTPRDPKSHTGFVRGLTGDIDIAHLYQKLLKPITMVASTEEGELVGIISGTRNRINKLFVKSGYHRRGIATELYRRYGSEAIRAGTTTLKVRASLFGEPFYASVGFKRSTGVRKHHGMKHAPMLKSLVAN